MTKKLSTAQAAALSKRIESDLLVVPWFTDEHGVEWLDADAVTFAVRHAIETLTKDAS